MRIASIKSNNGLDWIVTTTTQPSWFERVVLKQAPRTMEFYSKTGSVWYSIPDMDRVSGEYEFWLGEEVSKEEAREAYTKSQHYVKKHVNQ